MENGFEILLQQEYSASEMAVFNLVKNGFLFKLTGADSIQFDFIKDGSFTLEFLERGTIYGTFTEIIQGKKISMNWNVSGFGRGEEPGTHVILSIIDLGNKVALEVSHTGIGNSESAEAKKRAWSEILNDLKKELSA